MRELKGNGVLLQKALRQFKDNVDQPMRANGLKGVIYVDLPCGDRIQLANTYVDGDNPDFMTVVGHDKQGNETHVLMHHSRVIFRLVIHKPSSDEEQDRVVEVKYTN